MSGPGRPRRMSLSDRQKEALAALRRHIAEHGGAPTYRELANALGLTSVSSAYDVVQRLAERGHLTITPDKARTIVLAEPDLEQHKAVAIEALADMRTRRLAWRQRIDAAIAWIKRI